MENPDKKRILVRAPSSKSLVIRSFPFFHQLKNEFPDAEIHVVLGQEITNFFPLLPFSSTLQVHPLPVEKNSLPGIHHFAYNLHDVFNVDLFFDLDDNFKSAFLGLTFRCKERVGFATGLNKLFLTKSYEPRIKPLAPDAHRVDLLERFLGKKFGAFKVAGVEKKVEEDDSSSLVEKSKEDNPFQELAPPPFLFVVISDLSQEKNKVAFWEEFFDGFVGIEFKVLSFCQDISAFYDFIKRQQKKNKFHVLSMNGLDDLKKEILDAQGVVADDLTWAEVGHYLGKKSFAFVDVPPFKKDGERERKNHGIDIYRAEHFALLSVIFYTMPDGHRYVLKNNELMPLDEQQHPVDIIHENINL